MRKNTIFVAGGLAMLVFVLAKDRLASPNEGNLDWPARHHRA